VGLQVASPGAPNDAHLEPESPSKTGTLIVAPFATFAGLIWLMFACRAKCRPSHKVCQADFFTRFSEGFPSMRLDLFRPEFNGRSADPGLRGQRSDWCGMVTPGRPQGPPLHSVTSPFEVVAQIPLVLLKDKLQAQLHNAW